MKILLRKTCGNKKNAKLASDQNLPSGNKTEKTSAQALNKKYEFTLPLVNSKKEVENNNEILVNRVGKITTDVEKKFRIGWIFKMRRQTTVAKFVGTKNKRFLDLATKPTKRKQTIGRNFLNTNFYRLKRQVLIRFKTRIFAFPVIFVTSRPSVQET